MSHGLFIHDFFQDGRLDVLAEIRVMQVCGQWTKEKRSRWTKQAITYYQRSKRDYPLGSSYYAGRIAGLRSATTAYYPTLDPECHGKTVFLSIGDEKKILCLECGDDASWKCHPDGSGSLMFHLCDRCKQERVRTEASTTPFGWDHDRHELLPLPVPVGDKLKVTKQFEPVSVFLPPTALAGLGLLDMTLHIPILLFVTQAVLLLHFMIWGKNALQKVCKWLVSEL